MRDCILVGRVGDRGSFLWQGGSRGLSVQADHHHAVLARHRRARQRELAGKIGHPVGADLLARLAVLAVAVQRDRAASRPERPHALFTVLDPQLLVVHYFTVHNITWRALPAEFGNWNSVWKRFWRLSRTGVFEAFFQLLAETSRTAHLVQMFDSTVIRAHVSAAGAKGGSKIRLSDAHAVGSRAKSTSSYGAFVAFACVLILVKSVHTA